MSVMVGRLLIPALSPPRLHCSSAGKNPDQAGTHGKEERSRQSDHGNGWVSDSAQQAGTRWLHTQRHQGSFLT
jgi:hypothetical protein